MPHDQPEMGIEEATEALLAKHRTPAAGEAKDPDSPAATGHVDEDDEAEEAEDRGTDSDPDEDVEDSDDAQDDESDSDEAEDGDSEDDDDSDDDTEEYVFTVKDDSGEEIGVTAEEAQKGYLRQRDYTKKTQEVAEDRKATQALKEELTESKQQLAQVLQSLAMSADKDLAEFASIDWKKLEQEDPYGYEEKARRCDALRRQHEQASEHQKALQAEYEQEFNERVEQKRQEEQQKLLERAPEFDPEQGGKELHESLLATARDQYGFTDEEMGQIFDHRALLLLRDAHRYHEMQSKVQKGKKKSEKVTKHLKPGAKPAPGARKTKAKQELRSKMQSSGSMDDAMKFLMASMSAGRK